MRGADKQCIFLDDSDYRFFLSLFKDYLSKEKQKGSVEVLAYCLMPDHFHLLLFQLDNDGISKLMQKIMAGYSLYLHSKYSKDGPVFENDYKASRISSDEYLLLVSRYIHRSPDEWIDYPYSSLRAYLYNDTPDWMNKKRIAKLYGSAVKYHEFLKDYKRP
jgi:REP element-mobilizing transposase RayT